VALQHPAQIAMEMRTVVGESVRLRRACIEPDRRRRRPVLIETIGPHAEYCSVHMHVSSVLELVLRATAVDLAAVLCELVKSELFLLRDALLTNQQRLTSLACRLAATDTSIFNNELKRPRAEEGSQEGSHKRRARECCKCFVHLRPFGDTFREIRPRISHAPFQPLTSRAPSTEPAPAYRHPLIHDNP
jgi:hypothetical protein